MCGRYALGIRASFVRRHLEEHGMPVEDAPEDEDVRQTYNFAPGSHGLVYRADVPDQGAGYRSQRQNQVDADESNEGDDGETLAQFDHSKEVKYKLQAMNWGLIPFWTKRNPDYASVLKTINARDDSLRADGGMWSTMKKGKRCIVIAQGFYEWLKKNGAKEKIPHYTKRKDGQLMCFAGLWDCVQYEGMLDPGRCNLVSSISKEIQGSEKKYTYTIITTDSNKQLSFLHDRMPVILENGSEQIRDWLDPNQSEWSQELQSLLKPFRGELECYAVSKEVGKVGNNSPTFIIPVASAENKNNIANFFAHGKKAIAKGDTNTGFMAEPNVEGPEKEMRARHPETEGSIEIDQSSAENSAVLPVPASTSIGSPRLKRRHEADNHDAQLANSQAHPQPVASPGKARAKKPRSATSNGAQESPVRSGVGSQRITSFFSK